MGFEDYLESNLSTHKDDLSKEQINYLKGLYDKLLILQNKANMVNGNKEEYAKVMQQVTEASQKLAGSMEELKDSFGIEEFEDISRHSM